MAAAFEDVDVAFPIDGDRARVKKRRLDRERSIGGHAFLAVAGDDARGAGLDIDGVNAPQVSHVEVGAGEIE